MSDFVSFPSKDHLYPLRVRPSAVVAILDGPDGGCQIYLYGCPDPFKVLANAEIVENLLYMASTSLYEESQGNAQ